MINNMYLIYDKVSALYTMPLILTNDKVAIRYFKQQVIEDRSDFDLYKVGTYDNESAVFDIKKLILLFKGSELDSLVPKGSELNE